MYNETVALIGLALFILWSISYYLFKRECPMCLKTIYKAAKICHHCHTKVVPNAKA